MKTRQLSVAVGILALLAAACGPVPFDPFTSTWAEITWLDK